MMKFAAASTAIAFAVSNANAFVHHHQQNARFSFVDSRSRCTSSTSKLYSKNAGMDAYDAYLKQAYAASGATATATADASPGSHNTQKAGEVATSMNAPKSYSPFGRSPQAAGTGIHSYLDWADGIGTTWWTPFLKVMNEACDADEPTVECADAIADYLDVVSANGDDQKIIEEANDVMNNYQHAQRNMNEAKEAAIINNRNIQSQEQSQVTTQEEEQQQEQLDSELESQESLDRYLNMVSTEVGVKNLLGENPYALTDIPVKVLVQRFLDNLEDSTQKNNGKIKGQSKLKGKKGPAEERPTVVVLGTGWGAHAFIKLASTYDLRIVVVSPVNHFVFTPMLASAAVGTIEYRSMTEPIRVTNPYIDNYVEGGAIGIDVPNKKLSVQLTSLSTVTGAFKGIAAHAPCRLEPEPLAETEGNEDSSDASRVIELNYDYLLCAVGTSVRSSMVPGAKEHCFNLKTSQDSKRLRTAIGEALEYASRPDVQESYYVDPQQQEMATEERRRRLRFFIVGGGPTGVELCGELSDFFSQVCRKPDGAFQHLAKDISITLVHGGAEILPQMDTDLRQLALAAMQLQGVEVRLNTRLKEVGRDYVRLGKKGSDEEETIPVGLTVWAAGNAPVPFVNTLLSQLPESAAGSAGRINVDKWLRCPTPTPETFGSILVLGDAACLEADPKYSPNPNPLPQTAQVAGQQGAFAARLLNRGYDLQKTPPRLPETTDEFSLLRVWLLARGLNEAPEFTFLSLGLLAYIGRGEALNQVQLGDVPIFNYAGKIAFALWRSVYLSKQAATRNQALIAFDWLRTEAFGRDITRL